MDPHTMEDGELEDGEICDDETEDSAPPWRGGGGRPPGRGAPPRSHRPPPQQQQQQQHPRDVMPLLGPPPPDFLRLMPYNIGPHGPFPPGHRQQCGPSGPDRPPAPSPPGPPPGLGVHGEPSPRSSFWERSHGALGRFRHRALPNVGRGGWKRGGRGGNNRAPPGRYGPGESHGSPSRKPKQPARNRPRKVIHSVPKPETSVDESFEDLLSKYKQIQLELECIRKEETMALGPAASPVPEEVPPVPDPDPGPPEAEELERAEKKVFRAFNIKPLRQRLPRPAELDELQKKWAEPEEGDGAEAEGEQPITDECEEAPCSLCGEPAAAAAAAAAGGEARLKPAKDSENQETSPDHNSLGCREASGPEAATPGGSRVTTRSASSSAAAVAAAAAEGSRTRSKSTDLDQKKNVPKPAPKASPGKKVASPGDQPVAAGGAAESEKKCEVTTKENDRPPCVCCGASPASSEDSTISADKPVPKVEEEELSELQLRLLALQSASKKWQQKEQQVMKKSKDRITKVAPERSPGAAPPSRSRVTTRSAAAAERNRTRSKPADLDRIKSGPKPPSRDRDRPKPGLKGPPERGRPPEKAHLAKKITGLGSVGKQAFRKQQLRTWKLQQNEQEEDERRKREEEIRRIRDLSNQDEQYNRFMKLVGGRKRPRSKSRDEDHRKLSGKGGLDSSGNLYQYDNYDEVAMDTDSETGSPVPSPTRNLLTPEEAGRHTLMYGPDAAAVFGVDFSQSFFSAVLPGGPPPPPPLPPPPDELEPPPKPPFADEEEEEEMLLRETCLMSMAHKRVAATERSSSDPPSPSCAPPSDGQPPVRGNLSTVSLNMVAQSQRKFSRGHHAGRAPLVLPRHKAVVVSLNDSEDSDSDADAGSSMPSVFGGLEFMIKEARRTVEAAKPKAATGCEKENNPVRTVEVLPDAKKVESGPLKDQISRDKPRAPRDDPSSTAASQTAPDLQQRPAADLNPAEPEQRLGKLRELLQRDEAVLKHLLQQELKKTESLKASEAKVSKLREQLQASEKIANGNRALLRKLQEQVRRVEQRVSVKRTVVQRVEREVLQAQQHTFGGANRKAEAGQPAKKLQRVDAPPRGSERHFAELIAHKQRLQQLESEYALKIQKLKAAQALRNKAAAAAEVPPRFAEGPGPPLQRPPPPSPLAPPQPSLHDLTQDKLTLDSEDGPEADDAEAALAAASAGAHRSSRRRSSGSFTRPHLDVSTSTPAKDGGAKPTQMVLNAQVPPEMWAGLNVDALKQTYQQRAPIGELLLTELQKLGEQVDTPPAGQVLPLEVEPATGLSGSSELRPVPFGAYHSPLLVFRSYRFSPYYRTKEKLSLSSVTFSNAVDVTRSFCRFDLTGTCNHDGCTWQHMRNVTLTGNRLFEDILSYNLSLIGCSESSSDDDISAATESYMKKVFGTNKDRMGVDQKAVLLVSKVNESQHHVPPYTTCKEPRRWRPRPQGAAGPEDDDDSGDEAADARLMPKRAGEDGVSGLGAVDACVTSEDRRYFLSETDDVWNLESSVSESPGDTQLWIKLAFKYLSQTDSPAEENLEAALNTLSRALESNCEDPEVWSHYLTLFSRRGSSEEVQEMCEMAVEHAANHRVWWQYLTLESSFEGKDSVCERLLHFLLAEASAGVSEKLSFQLMEALLYRVQLSVFSGRTERGVTLLQSALKEQDVAAHLLPADRALLWLAYIHLLEFERLPYALYDPAESGPSRMLRPRSFLLPWKTPQDVRTPLGSLIALLQDGVRQCSEDGASDKERTQACMPLHTNLIHLYRLLHRFDDAVSHCESLLRSCPDSCAVRGALAELHMCSGEEERALSVWLLALSECPHNAEVFYHCCCFLMEQEKSNAIVPLFKGFILSLCEDEQNLGNPTHILRNLLGFSSDGLRGSVIKKNLQESLSQQTCFLHLIHCRWQWLHGSAEQAAEAFERALGSNLQLEELHRLWMDYLRFTCSPQAGSGGGAAVAAAHSRKFSDLVHRCLSTVPTRLEVPFNAAMFWSCYRFHNQVVSLYLGRVPQSQHALLLERLHSAMPSNTELGLRLLLLLWQDGLKEQLRFQAHMLSSSSPRCLSVWKILLAVQVELKQQVEVRAVYQQALQHLPLCADLWKHRLQFEAAVGGASERLRQLLDACRRTGVSVSLSGGVGGL